MEDRRGACQLYPEDRSYFDKIGHFFTARLLELTASQAEHELEWLAPSHAESQMAHRSHAWAIKRACRSKTT